MKTQTDFARTGRLYRKIDIYVKEAGGWVYQCSTNQWRLCRDARQYWCDIHLSGNTHRVMARFALRD